MKKNLFSKEFLYYAIMKCTCEEPNKYNSRIYVFIYFYKMPPHQKEQRQREKSNKTEMECECVYLDCYYCSKYLLLYTTALTCTYIYTRRVLTAREVRERQKK